MRNTSRVPFGRVMNGRSVLWPRRFRGSGGKRSPELWERVREEYPAATVLEDLDVTGGDVAAALRILARFASLRIVLLVLYGNVTSDELAAEREIARSYTDMLPVLDPERHALSRIVSFGKPRLRQSIMRCANDAGELAIRQNHAAGGFWLHHIAYAVSLGSGWRSEACRAARAIEAAAAAAGASRSARLWRARAVALQPETR